MSERAEQPPSACNCCCNKRRVQWPDDHGGVLAQIFEYDVEGKAPTSRWLVAIDIAVTLLTSTTLISMSLGYFGHMLAAICLLVVMLVGAAHRLLIVDGADWTGALESFDDEAENLMHQVRGAALVTTANPGLCKMTTSMPGRCTALARAPVLRRPAPREQRWEASSKALAGTSGGGGGGGGGGEGGSCFTRRALTLEATVVMFMSAFGLTSHRT